MARTYTANDAKALLHEHDRLAKVLEQNIGYVDRVKGNCRDYAIRLLRNHVFSSEVDGEFTSGVGKEQLSSEIYLLIEQLYRYINGRPLTENCISLQRDHKQELEREMQQLKPAANGVLWLFTSGKKKALANSAYDTLYRAAHGDYAQTIEFFSNAIDSINNTEHEEVTQAFGASKLRYKAALLEIVPEVFQKELSIKKLQDTTNAHNALFQRIDAASGADEHTKDRIKNAVDGMVAAEVLKILKGVPIEELGREKIGIRYKALHDFGYHTVADVFCATQNDLASVYGISNDTAYAIKWYARQYAEQAQPGVKIRLSVDNKSAEATELVAQIYRLRQQQSMCESLEQLKREHGNRITNAIENLHHIGNGVEWLFMERLEKQDLIKEYQYLEELLHGEYAENIILWTELTINPERIDATQAWDDFERNNIVYFNILEGLVPGILGNDDTWFGLPEEFAREIQDQCFFLDGLKCNLRRYQEWGVKYILHQGRVLLGDEMGLGKTIQAIAAMVSLENTGATHFFVVCPASVLPNWCKEIAEKSKLRVTKIHGQGRMNAFDEWRYHGGVAVTNFETTGHLKMEPGFQFDMMIVDEAHYIKNSDAQRTKNVNRIGEHTSRILYMTGTALENKVEEMISLVTVLQPSIATQLHSIAFMSSAPQFREKVAPVYYRRKREDVLTELPELIETKEWCMMMPEEEALYEDTVLTKHYMQVRRVSWNVDNLDKSCKARRLKEIIHEATNEGRKVIVFSYFLDTMKKIGEYLGSCCMPPIHGSVSPNRRQEIIDQFDGAPAGTVLLAQIQSGGTGLNIQAASVVIICEPQLKPSIENQAISRAYRMGQAHNVLVYRLLCEDSIDEKITDLLAEKQAVFDAFADKSVSAEATALEDVAIDEKTMGRIIKEEIDRINAKNGKSPVIKANAEKNMPTPSRKR